MQLSSDSGACVNQADVCRDHLFEHGFEKGVMRAAKNEGVRTGSEQRLDIPGQQLTQSLAVQVAVFDQLHKAWARLGNHPYIGGETIEQRRKLGAL